MGYKVHEFLPGLGLVKRTAEVAGRRNAVLLFHPAHLHAHVLSLNDDHNTEWMKGLLDAFLDLQCHALLHLQAVAIDIDDTGNLGKPRDIAIWDISHMDFAIERQHVVLAKRKEVYILNDDHLGVVFLEKGIGQHLMSIHAVAPCQHLHGFGHAHRCLEQSVSLNILTQQGNDTFVVCGEFVQSLAEYFVFWIHD